MCVSRDGARRAVVVGSGRRDTYLLLHVRRDAAPAARVARCWGCMVGWGGARRLPFFGRRGARAAAPLDEVMAHSPMPALRAGATAAFT